jgi:hypothetical protein
MPGSDQPLVTTTLLRLLAQLYDAVTSENKPALDLVPLFPYAGWTIEAVCSLHGIRVVLAGSDLEDVGRSLTYKLNETISSVSSSPVVFGVAHKEATPLEPGMFPTTAWAAAEDRGTVCLHCMFCIQRCSRGFLLS